MMLLAAVALQLGFGYLLAERLVPSCGIKAADFLFSLSAGTGVSFALGSALSFLLLSLSLDSATIASVDAAIHLCAIAALLFLKHGYPTENQIASDAEPAPRSLVYLAWATVLAALALFVLVTAKMPVGRWDAYAIWNTRARFLFLGGQSWRELAFGYPERGWHLDYPLLLPLSIFRLYCYMGHDSPLAQQAVAFLFTSATAGLLFSVLRIIKNSSAAWAGLILLCGHTLLSIFGASQYAEIEVAYYFLLGFVALIIGGGAARDGGLRAGMLVLAGVAASAAAFTKNEGLAYLMTIFLLCGLSCAKDRQPAAMKYLLLGLLPAALALAFFKLRLAPPSGFSLVIDKLLSPAAYCRIAGTMLRQMLFFEESVPWRIPALAAFVLLVGMKTDERYRKAIGLVWAGIMLMLLSYFAAYLSAVSEQAWHVGPEGGRTLFYRTGMNFLDRYIYTTAVRLTFQLWPSILLAALLSADMSAFAAFLGRFGKTE